MYPQRTQKISPVFRPCKQLFRHFLGESLFYPPCIVCVRHWKLFLSKSEIYCIWITLKSWKFIAFKLKCTNTIPHCHLRNSPGPRRGCPFDFTCRVYSTSNFRSNSSKRQSFLSNFLPTCFSHTHPHSVIPQSRPHINLVPNCLSQCL